MTPRPVIAVIGRRAERVSGIRYSGTIAAEAMCEAVWAAGGEPLVLHGPDGEPGAEIEARLRRFDGVLLPGGNDLDPRRYGQVSLPGTEPACEHQDSFELAVASAALNLAIPSLAVCRGMQVLNVALGGTLLQQLPPSEVEHLDELHDVVVVEGSRLHEILHATRVQVSSYHHQAIERLGADLRITATAADGCVEALEHREGSMLAVQWHPEDLHATSTTDHALFVDLVERAGGRSTRPLDSATPVLRS